MGRMKIVEIDGGAFLRVEGVRRVYIMRAGERIAFGDDDWCLLVRGDAGRKWVSCRLFRLFDGVRAYSFGVHSKTWLTSKSDGSVALESAYPGVLAWAARVAMHHVRGHQTTLTPPGISDRPAVVADPPDWRREATKEEEALIVDAIRERQTTSMPLSQRRATRPHMRYIGDVVEAAHGIPEAVALEAVKKLILYGVVEDYLVDARRRMRGLRTTNPEHHKQYFDANAERGEMSGLYVSPRGRHELGERDLIDEVDGWQIQYAPRHKRAGIAFKVTDIRDERRRRLTPDKPWRRVYDVVYNTRADRCGGVHWMSLADHHPEVAAWAAREIAAYCRRVGLATKKSGGDTTKKRTTGDA